MDENTRGAIDNVSVQPAEEQEAVEAEAVEEAVEGAVEATEE